MANDPARQWAQNLVAGGYDAHCESEADVRRIARLGLAWRRILRATGLKAPASVFEIGCGGGEKLATLALNGFRGEGIDISRDVLARARNYFREIEAQSRRKIEMELNEGDFLSHASERQFALVYHSGVVEHYLDADSRRSFWNAAYGLTAPGGWIVSIVPCGRHIMRRKMRDRELYGYRRELAEIDYSSRLHIEEFRNCGLVKIRSLPHGFFFFLSSHPSRAIRKFVYPALSGFALLVSPMVPSRFSERFAHTLIVIGQKPGG